MEKNIEKAIVRVGGIGGPDIEVLKYGIIIWDGVTIMADMNLDRIKHNPESALAFMKSLVGIIEKEQERLQAPEKSQERGASHMKDERGPVQQMVEARVIALAQKQYDYIRNNAVVGAGAAITVRLDLDPALVKSLADELAQAEQEGRRVYPGQKIDPKLWKGGGSDLWKD